MVASCSSGRGTGFTSPPKVTPAPHPTELAPPPSDAIVLFDGTDLSQWTKENGKPAGWRLNDGYVEVKLFSGSIISRQSFGDIQLHIEWATPDGLGRGQHKGNSGIKFMGRYELQILDSFENETYPDGQAGAIYSQHQPLVNASRPPGVWQSYDVIFQSPRFDVDGQLQSPAYMTVFHNGVLIQDHAAIAGPTKGTDPYQAHAARLPLHLQNHRSKVRFRNIWVRDLEG